MVIENYIPSLAERMVDLQWNGQERRERLIYYANSFPNSSPCVVISLSRATYLTKSRDFRID